jgi:hypothetical protein
VRDRLFSLNCARSLALTDSGDAALALVREALPFLRGGLGADAPATLRAEALLAELGRGALPARPDPRRGSPGYFS